MKYTSRTCYRAENYSYQVLDVVNAILNENTQIHGLVFGQRLQSSLINTTHSISRYFILIYNSCVIVRVWCILYSSQLLLLHVATAKEWSQLQVLLSCLNSVKKYLQSCYLSLTFKHFNIYTAVALTKWTNTIRHMP